MNSPDSRRLQVALTGSRIAPCSDAELLARLKAKFRLSDEKGAALLNGRCVVKRDIDVASARKLVLMFAEVGLQATIEEVKSSAGAAPARAPAPAAAPAAPAPAAASAPARAPAPAPAP